MAIHVLTSAAGSPGVTTTVMALATVWPRPVVVLEADPTGGSAILAGFYRGMADELGLIDLVMANRQGQLKSTLPTLLRPVEGTQASLLVGTRSHDQAVGLESVWLPLLEALRELEGNGQDVLVDAGRLGLDGTPMPLMLGADTVSVLMNSNLPAVSAARSWVVTLRDRAAGQLGVVVVGDGRPYSAREVAGALGVSLTGSVEWAPSSAAVFSEGADYPPAGRLGRLAGRKATKESFARGPYLRSVATVGDVLRRRAAAVVAPDPLTSAEESAR